MVMISNVKGNNRSVPEEFEQEMNMWLQEHTWKGKEKQFHTRLHKETPRVRRHHDDNRVYTEGSFDPATNKAGYGIYYGPEHTCTRSERVEGEQLIARAELMAILKTLEEHPVKSELTILTDSQIFLKMLKKWTSPYTKGNLKGVPNEDLIRRAVTMLEIRQTTKTMLLKVQAHVAILGNEKADMLAKRSLEKEEPLTTRTDDYVIDIAGTRIWHSFRTKLKKRTQALGSNNHKPLDGEEA
jgi:ribonuclease HI